MHELRRLSNDENGHVSTRENGYEEMARTTDSRHSSELETSHMLQTEEKVSCPHMVKSLDGGPPVIETEEETLKPLHYRVSETPPAHLLLFFALQQVLVSISAPLSVTLVVSEIICSQKDEIITQQVLSASMFMVGVATFLMSTFGLRLPILQGPSPVYLIPLLAMSSSPEWKCPEFIEGPSADNATILYAVVGNNATIPARDIMFHKLSQMSGSLVVVGVIHFLIGATGLVGIIIRYIGPVTIVPSIVLVAVHLYPLVVRFSRPSILVAFVTCAVNLILSLFLENRMTPVPFWSRTKGFHILWFPLHQMFSVLISILVGWAFSGILTAAGFFTDDPTNIEYLARTDAKGDIISQAPFFEIPYPGKLGGYSFNTAAFLSFLIASLLSVFDSVGDYSACARTTRVTPVPRFAFNRGIAVEGLTTIMSGSLGCSHATVSYGGNIGAIGITGVASRRVFQVGGLVFVAISIMGKLGAAFLTIPLPVLGASSLIMSGIFVGVALSYLEALNLRSVRNLAIIGISLMLGFALPDWATKYPDEINTGSKDVDMFLTILLTNPCFVASTFACLMDNAVPGTLRERGLLEQIKELDADHESSLPQKNNKFEEGREVYRLPFIPNKIRQSRISKLIPLFDHVEC